ncbi:MAG: hypothetical protein IPK32_24665 [Verrucomicrobiaceae bacterium]|nr:hypothetical protein [Verrucomicrobiaceae bacterium]
MSSIVVASISRVASDANRAVARNLQVSIQSALTQYVIDQTTNSTTGRLRSLEAVRAEYNDSGLETMHRFNLLIPRPASGSTPASPGYLDQTTVDHILEYSTGQTQKLRSAALDNLGEWLELPDWETGGEPTVIFKRP